MLHVLSIGEKPMKYKKYNSEKWKHMQGQSYSNEAKQWVSGE